MRRVYVVDVVDEPGKWYHEGYVTEVERCVHGNVYRHLIVHRVGELPDGKVREWCGWCAGSPTFMKGDE